MSGPASLTPRQREVMAVIQAWFDRDGTGPSTRELSLATGGCGNPGDGARLLNQLQARGWIERHQGRARSIRILHRLPS